MTNAIRRSARARRQTRDDRRSCVATAVSASRRVGIFSLLQGVSPISTVPASSERRIPSRDNSATVTDRRYNKPMTISDLPAINASFNLVSTLFIASGWYLIRRGAWRRHMACMIVAVISSAFFLVGYIVYHVHMGERSSGYTGWIAAIYFPILASHVLLAFVTLPLVILTLVPVFRRRWDRHRRIARWTIPIWLYVSITGVLVYLMLYKWFPPPSVALGQ
jgi:putative membrane protein